uniref:Pathway specific regulator n=1 Tax=Streptomyces roseofulvus TaxID=33902 RepID=O68913_9ACTN|nr:pathway specific regulator [Streptomyces roseofulvus]
MEIKYMGQLTMRWEGREKLPSARKPRTVLALLLLNDKTPVTTSALITELWGENPPRSALTTLQTYILQLRKCLAAMSGRSLACISEKTLVTWPCGYLARLPADATSDVAEFRRFAREGREAERRGHLAEAVRSYRAALSLSQGPLLADIEHGPLLRAEAVRMEECRLSLVERSIEGDLLLGRHREVVSELSALVAQYPYHEQLTGQLMVALVRCGRRQDALAVHQRLRARMVEDLGLEPSSHLRALQSAVLSGEPLPGPPGTGGEIPTPYAGAFATAARSHD